MESIIQDVIGAVLGSRGRDDALKKICEIIREGIPRCDWIGFYITDPGKRGELVLGPYIGEPTEHVRIPFGRGICGIAAERGETVVVSDVSLEKDYLSCSPKVKSEIVIPIMRDQAVLGELDIDSHTPDAFGDEEREILEAVCEVVADLF
jgi:L-methionine (R)-S-oxide reductase